MSTQQTQARAFDAKAYIQKDGLKVIDESYQEFISGCRMTIQVNALENKPINPSIIRYTFWLFRFPAVGPTSYNIWLSSLRREPLL